MIVSKKKMNQGIINGSAQKTNPECLKKKISLRRK
jgi:hypothetical protein